MMAFCNVTVKHCKRAACQVSRKIAEVIYTFSPPDPLLVSFTKLLCICQSTPE